MAYTALNVSGDTSASYTVVAADASNGNKFLNDGKKRLVIINPDAASITCTIAIPASSDTAFADGNTITDLAVATSATYYVVKPLRPDIYNQSSGADQGSVVMTWTGTVTNVKLAVI